MYILPTITDKKLIWLSTTIHLPPICRQQVLLLLEKHFMNSRNLKLNMKYAGDFLLRHLETICPHLMQFKYFNFLHLDYKRDEVIQFIKLLLPVL